MTAITVHTQAELDAALNDPDHAFSTHEIIIDSPAGVWLEVSDDYGQDVHAYGSSAVIAFGSSSVTAHDSATVRAHDSSSVTTFNSSTVTAFNSSAVQAFGSSLVIANDSSSVIASDSVSRLSFAQPVSGPAGSEPAARVVSRLSAIVKRT